MTYKITAQSYSTSHRITKTISAANESTALKNATLEVEVFGYYVTSIVAV